MLAIAPSATGVLWAVVDPFEARAAGVVRCRPSAWPFAIRRLIRQTKPTAVAGSNARLRRALVLATRGTGLPLVIGRFPKLPLAVAIDLFPELRLRAPTAPLQSLAVLAIAVVLHANVPPRRYAPRRR